MYAVIRIIIVMKIIKVFQSILFILQEKKMLGYVYAPRRLLEVHHIGYV